MMLTGFSDRYEFGLFTHQGLILQLVSGNEVTFLQFTLLPPLPKFTFVYPEAVDVLEFQAWRNRFV